MRILAPSDFQRQPWKNGGGITYEIAREDGAQGLLWRLSIAEVASNGPFSPFPGLSRILTVLSGAGLHLRTTQGSLEALPLQPIAFSGDLAIDSELIGDPVHDFNLIYNAKHISGTVSLVTGDLPACPKLPATRYALLAIGQDITLDGQTIPAGGIALFDQASAQTLPPFAALLVRLAHLG